MARCKLHGSRVIQHAARDIQKLPAFAAAARRQETMMHFRTTFTVALAAASLSLIAGGPAAAATYVYVSNAEDGDIGMYALQPDGSLQPGQRFKAEKLAMPMAVSPDKRFLI